MRLFSAFAPSRAALRASGPPLRRACACAPPRHRDRSASRDRRLAPLLVRSASVITLVAGLAACGGLRAEDRDHPLADDEVPYDLLAAPTTSTTEPPPPTTTTLPWRTNLWYVAGNRIVPAPRQLREQPEVDQVLRLLLRGPADDDLPLVRSALDVGDATVVGRPVGGTLTIALTADFGARSPSEQVLALGQLVFTVTEVPGVGRVVFRIGTADLAVPLPSGQLAQGSVSRDDYAVLAFPVPVR